MQPLSWVVDDGSKKESNLGDSSRSGRSPNDEKSITNKGSESIFFHESPRRAFLQSKKEG